MRWDAFSGIHLKEKRGNNIILSLVRMVQFWNMMMMVMQLVGLDQKLDLIQTLKQVILEL